MTSAKIFLSVIIIALAISLILYPQKLIVTSDFVNIYTAATILKNSQAINLYDIERQKIIQRKLVNDPETKFLPFRHSPVIALLFFPFSFLNLKPAYVLFAYLNVLELLLFYLLAKKIFSHIYHDLLFVVLIFLSIPTLHTIFTGQTPILLSLTLLIEYIYLKRKDWFRAGLVGSLIFFLKIQLFVLIPFIFLLAKSKKKFLAGFILSSLILLIISARIVGLPGLLNYPDFIVKTENAVYGSHLWDSFSLVSILSKLGIAGGLFFMTNFIGYFLALISFYSNLNRRSLSQNFVISLIFTALFAVHFLAHDLTILNVAILILFDRYYQVRNESGQILFYLSGLLYSIIFFFIIPTVLGLQLNLGVFGLLFTAYILIKQKLWT